MTDAIIQKLEASAVDTLTSLAVDHLLVQPISDLIDPPTLAQQTVLTVRQAVQSEETEARILASLQQFREMRPSGTLRDSVPPDVIVPLCTIIAKPVNLNRAMVGRVLEHGAIEELLREILVSALQSFAQRIRPAVPSTGKTGNRLRTLKKVGEGMLGGLGAEIERQAEQKAKDFVDGMLSTAIAQAADEMCNPAKAATYGKFRGHILDQLLDTPISELMAEMEKVEPEDLLATTTAILCAITERETIEEEVQQIIRTGLQGFEGQSLGDVLDEAGLESTWRGAVENHVSHIARGFIATPEFKEWLGELLGDPSD